MNLPKSLTTVTPFSKALALLLFLAFLATGVFIGMSYQKYEDQTSENIFLSASPTITPSVPPLKSLQNSCTKDSDCVLSEISNDTTATCCPNTRCLDLSKSDVEAVNANWLDSEKQNTCQGHYMCPMIYALCTKEITQTNSHYSAKCESGECVKIYQ